MISGLAPCPRRAGFRVTDKALATWLRCALGAVASLALGCGVLAAQTAAGTIRGTVTDPSGASVAHAQVVATQLDTGFTRRTASGPQGSYVLVLLPVGRYRLEATAPGFRKYVRQGITVSVNQAATVPVELTVGSPQQTVQVSGDAELLQTTNDLGETVHEREILGLPLNGRNFTQLGLLQPGVAPLTQGLIEAGGSLRAGQSYAVNGQRPESNEFLIDGAENFDSVDGGFVLRPPVDAITEFRILTNTASAEFGRTAGSTTDIVTRAGTNHLHGDAYDFLRNDALDARNFFASTVEPLKQNQFGGTLGGPLRRDKRFFFGYYEGFRNRQGETRSATVPSLIERQGDFSQSVDPSTGEVPPLINFFTGQPFEGNKLPGIDPIAANILQFYPRPNSGINRFVTTQTLSNDQDQFGARIDHYFPSRTSLFFRYGYASGSQLDPLSIAGANVPGFPVGEDLRAQNAAIESTHTFSPTLLYVGRFSFVRDRFLFGEVSNHTPLSSLGFQYSPTLAVQAGPPFVEIAGYASVGDPITGPRDTYQTTFALTDSVAWVHHQHEVKFGDEYRRDRLNVVMGIASNGFFVFVPFPISNPLASFEIGQPIVFLQGGGNLERGLRASSYSFYVEDSYKPTAHLTLNVGLRYELPLPFHEVHNQQNLFVPGRQSDVIASAPAGLLYPGDPGVAGGLIRTEYRAFAPRLGLAWDPTGSGRWAIRAAYGIFYDPYTNGQGGPLQDPISAPPWFKTIQLSLPNFANPIPAGSSPFAPIFAGAQALTLLVLDPNLGIPYAQDWNFNVERSFGDTWLLDLGYVGTKGTKLPRFLEGNPAVFVPGQSTADNVNQRRLYSGCTLASSPGDCVYGSVGFISGIANSSYHSLQASLRKRLSHGLSFLGSYTFSKTIDDASSFNITGSSPQSVAGENDLAQNPFDLAAERGRSLFDARHRFIFSYEWELPFWQSGQTWYQYAFGGWQANGIVTLATGTPFTVYDSSDPSLEGQAPEISGFFSDRPNLVGNPNNGPKTPADWFNLQAFQRVTTPGAFGSAGRNIVEGPGLAVWDLALLKDFRLTEAKRLEFRAEMFNLLNRANFGLPVNDINSPTFGQVQSALPPRQIQFGLKLIF